jgi:DNA-binding MarR family transcriptional regulator
MSFKFAVINPLLHNELRLKIMVALDCLESADFMYLCEITDAARGNLSIQLGLLMEAGYLERSRNGVGRLAHTVCRITEKGREALHTYEQGLKNLFTEEVPAKEAHSLNV